MSRAPSSGLHDDSSGDTPPYGMPPVARAAVDDDEEDGGDLGAAAGGADQDPAADEGVDEDPAVDAAGWGAAGGGRHAARRGTRRRRRLTRRGRLVAALGLVLVVLAGTVAWYEVEANPFGAPGKTVLVHVHAGESLGAIETALASHQVVGTAVAFRIWSLIHGAPIVGPGIYQLHRNLSFSAAAAALNAGPNVYELTVVPGMTISEIAGQLASLPGNLTRAFSDAGAKAGVRSPFQPDATGPLEGLIGTGTYRILPGETGHELLEQMVARFDAEATAAGLKPTTTVGGLNAYQLVTVASIAQKEGYFTRYLGEVARVVFNRLAAGMRLDMTSTILYSLGKDGGPVTPQEERITTPYNTYLHAGLTPTPICTPSEQALRASLHAPQGSWLYFDLVTAKNGTMKFASSYTGQLALEREAAANAAKQSKHAKHAKHAATSSSGSAT